MKTQEIKNSWGFRSVSFWMTFLVAVGIIFIGLRFIVDPLAGATGFGIPLKELSYGRIKGIRDIFSGLVLLPFLFLKMRIPTALALTTAIIVPATDFSIVLLTNGTGDLQHLLIHGLTVVYMVITSILLFKAGSNELSHR